MMRLVMWINRGPTDLHTKVQFTNWAEVERFASQVAELARGDAASMQTQPQSVAPSATPPRAPAQAAAVV